MSFDVPSPRSAAGCSHDVEPRLSDGPCGAVVGIYNAEECGINYPPESLLHGATVVCWPFFLSVLDI